MSGKYCDFRHNIAYMGNLFVVSLDIPVTINVLYEMIKILHENRFCTDSITM